MINKSEVLARLDFRAFYNAELPDINGAGVELNAPCPFHDDSGRHFYANAETGYYKCQRCNVSGDVFTFMQERHGLDFQTALARLAERAGLSDGNGNGQKKKFKDDHARATTDNIRQKYHYSDEDEQYLFSTVRFEEAGRKKTFRQWRWDEKVQDYIPNIYGVHLVPYNLPEVLTANEIFLVEGEKDVESLRAIGLCGSCNAMGAGKWKGEYNIHFQGKHVVILPDNDQPGQDHAAMVCEALYPHVASAKLVDLPGLPEKGDVSDWLERGGTRDALLALVDQVPAWKPAWAMDCISAADFMEVEITLTPLVEGLLNERESLLVCGPSGLGKSVLTLNFALAAGMGADAGLWGLFPVSRPLRSLFVQSENSAAGTQARLRKIISAMPELRPALEQIIFPDPHRVTGELTDSTFQERLIDACRRHGADLLVLDPLISFHGQDENDNASMRRSLDCLSAICDAANVGTLLVHHVGKNTSDNGVFAGRGASAIGDWAANILLMKPTEIDGERTNIIEMQHQKARNFETVSPFYLERRRDLSMVRTENPQKRAKNAEAVEVVTSAMEDMGGRVNRKGALWDKLMRTTGQSRSTVRRMVDTALRQGAITECPADEKTRGAAEGYILRQVPVGF